MKKIEISLNDLVIAILRNWVATIMIAIIAALLFGSSVLFDGGPSLTQDLVEKRIAYEQDLITKRNLLAIYTQQRDAADLYIKDSLLMKLDPYKIPTATITFSVKPIEETESVAINDQATLSLSNSETVRRIANRYLILAQNTRLSNVLAAQYPNTSEYYLRELISIALVSDDLITIDMHGTSALLAEESIQLLYGFLAEQSESVAQSTVPHEITVISKRVMDQSRSDLAEKQIEQANLMVRASNDIAQLTGEIKMLEQKEPTPLSISSSLLQNGFIGFIVGVILGALGSAFFYVLRLPMQVPEQPQAFWGTRYLGGYRRKKGVFLGSLADKMSGDYLLGATMSEGLQIITSSLLEVIKDKKTLLITGNLPAGELAAFSEQLEKQPELSELSFLYGKDLNKNAATQRLLGQVDGVIILERLYQSSLKGNHLQIERVTQSGKALLGYAVY